MRKRIRHLLAWEPLNLGYKVGAGYGGKCAEMAVCSPPLPLPGRQHAGKSSGESTNLVLEAF